MNVFVHGIDLGKNVCSIVGLNALARWFCAGEPRERR